MMVMQSGKDINDPRPKPKLEARIRAVEKAGAEGKISQWTSIA